MKYSFLFILLLVSSSAWSQVLFKYDFKDCEPADICLYCGDAPARPPVKLAKYLQKKLNRAQFEYNGKGRQMLFQVYIDAKGKLCVLSIDDKHDMWQLRKDMRLELNNMPNWIPATLYGKPTHTSMVLEFTFHKDYFDIRYISKRPQVDGRVI
ncbi:hypothetical protein CJD36_020825 [Flavipsychrobacter stenotrophus]|uniref:TonB C-terminal domain-containing protein n=1 Tax=Flavipsychrobacter stenotrophus TaxID=2077091 RepID=A0A2S7SQY2_9BACT|nr:hypothetical protein [Flavipsychrobacter stenotrophus]PQJ09025.1 hypothetical protein CJD36_020825 [Flavipsychrobacter stenotrophus]